MSYHSLWIFASFTVGIAVCALFLCGLSASDKVYRRVRLLSIVLFALILAGYAFISMGALFIFAGRVGTFEGLFYLAPVTSPFVLLVVIFSVRFAAGLMWMLFVFLHGYYSFVNWPDVYGIVRVVSFDWPILATALALSIIAWQDKRRSVRAASRSVRAETLS